jgi:hypothetical protein
MNRLIVLFVLASFGAVWLSSPSLASERMSTTEVKQAGHTWEKIKAYTLDKKSEALAYGKIVKKSR